MLEKTRILWENLGQPNTEDMNCKKFLRCIPNITGIRLGDGKISILQMREKFRDFTFMATLPDICWQVLKDICNAYDNRLIFK